MNDNDIKELERRRLIDEVRESVEMDLKRRYSWLGIIALLVTSGFITVTVRDFLSEAKVDLATATHLQKGTTARLTKASDKLERIIAQANESKETVSRLEADAKKQYESLSKKATAISEKLSVASVDNLKISNVLRKDIKRLNSVVEGLVETLDDTTTERTKLISSLKTIDTSLKRSETDIESAERTAEFLRFPLRIRSSVGGAELEKVLRTRGYSPSIERAAEADEYITILLDDRLPIAEIIFIIKEAKKHIPYLRHVIAKNVLYDHLEDETYIGVWYSDKDLKKIPKLTDKEFDRLTTPGKTESWYRDQLKVFGVL